MIETTTRHPDQLRSFASQAAALKERVNGELDAYQGSSQEHKDSLATQTLVLGLAESVFLAAVGEGTIPTINLGDGMHLTFKGLNRDGLKDRTLLLQTADIADREYSRRASSVEANVSLLNPGDGITSSFDPRSLVLASIRDAALIAAGEAEFPVVRIGGPNVIVFEEPSKILED